MAKKRPLPSCYMCSAPSVDREHAPPQGFFPEDSTYRKNLIRVPSCKLHNGDKSPDDVVVRSYIANAEGNNELAFMIVDQKVMPRLEKNPHLTEVFLPDLRKLPDGRGRITLDLPRFETWVGNMVRALYYFDSKFRSKLLCNLDVVWLSLKNPRDLSNPEHYGLVRWAEQNLPPLDRGANPRIFKYRFDYSPDGLHATCRLKFYEGEPIYVFWVCSEQRLAAAKHA